MYGQKIDFKNHPYGSLGKDNLLSANTSIGDIDNDGFFLSCLRGSKLPCVKCG